ncbi:MAG TPA: chromosome partitioning protein ParB [Gammaproteobacteria bacterium]|nr:chromosome partitioning protein ParB [Gammaproteobacteria bacterium]
MTQRKRGLGRGLDALIGMTRPVMEAAHGQTPAADLAGELRRLPLARLKPGRYQPRVHMPPEALEELAESIRAQGIVQPIVVRAVDAEFFEIIAGERRFRAARLAGLEDVPVLVRDLSDRAALSVALIENIQRQDLNPMEEARALARLVAEFELTHEEAAVAVGRSRVAVSNLIRLLNASAPVREALEAGEIEMGHARALLALPDAAQPHALRSVREQALSVRATEALVRERLAGADALTRPGASDEARTPTTDPNVERLAQDLSERLGAPVSIRHGAKGGQLVIRYGSLDELDGILAHIR